MKRRVLLIAFGLSSCLLPRVDFDQSLGSAGTSAGGGGGDAPTGGTDAGGTVNPGGGRASSAGAPSAQGGKPGAGSAGATSGSAGEATGSAGEATGSAGEATGQGGKSGAGSGGAYTGGAPSSAGSTSAAGHGGSGVSGGGASGVSGGSGAGAGGCGPLAVSQTDPKCCVASAPTTNVPNSLAIDDLEDDDNAILPIGNRQGYWFSYSDSKTTLMPGASGGALTPTAGGHACSLLPVPPACAGVANGIAFSAAISGSLSIATSTTPSYAGLGFDFNNRLTKSCAYSGNAYQGISFWAKGNVVLRAMIKIPATTSTSTSASVGTCTVNCEDHYGILVPLLDPATWKQFTITFSDRVHFAQAGWGTPVTFDPSVLLAMQFQLSGTTAATTTTPYSFSIDDVAFIQ